MDKKWNITQYRGRLDKTLASDDLTNEETIKSLVKNQVLRSIECDGEVCIENVIERRTKDVSNFMQMLKSASVSDDDAQKKRAALHSGWKIKQDTEEYRVMYREGPEGTPFHTLLVEGYVDGPVDVCLCISWETTLYKKWWPQFTIPTFKTLLTECLQKVRIGEQISLVRMKVPWPLSAREAVVHFFEFEYIQDDLIVVLLNSISDMENIDRSTHGFSRDGIPDAQDVTRIDVVGGFAIQKVTTERSYFRTITNMDIKLDFVPPSFINFVSRQVIGSGFKLYQKEVVSVSKGDEDFGKALSDPLYTRVREALYSNYKTEALEAEDLKNDAMEEPILHSATQSRSEHMVIPDQKCAEIEEIEEEEIQESKDSDIEDSRDSEEGRSDVSVQVTNHKEERASFNTQNNVRISPEVKQALDTLERAISMLSENGHNPQVRSPSGLNNKESFDSEQPGLEDSQVCSNGVSVQELKSKMVEKILHEPRNSSSSRLTGSNSYLRETNHSKVVPASPEDLQRPSEPQHDALSSSSNERAEEQISDRNTDSNKIVSAEADDISKIGPTKRKKNKKRLCCLHCISGHLMH